jgi:hypothetical protein
MEAIWKKQYSLAEIVDPSQFKSYEELKKRLDYVLGITAAPKAPDPEVRDEEDDYSFQSVPKAMKEELNSLSSSNSNDEDDALSYFQRLAEE